MPTTLKPKPLKWLLLAISSLCLTNCATPPPDVAVFEDLPTYLAQDPATGHLEIRPSPMCETQIHEPSCGHGVYIMSKREVFVGEGKEHLFNGKPWSQLKSESILMPAQESYAPLSIYIINQCKKNSCSDEVDRFKIRLDELRGIGALINGF